MAKGAAKLPIFARRLAQARVRAGLTQAQVGVLAGMDPAVASPRINQYERGKHEPQLKTAKRLAQVLGIPAAFLYAEDEQLAELLLQWPELNEADKRKLLKQLAELRKARAARSR
ncbi:MAG: helix-turn-helix domain-containing protein [Pseudomonadota bacterium]|nr:helix-turn-helix domain-containing protein [Pseudomonadota bacterium]